MTWKRVATAGVLIPFVVGIVLWGSTAIVALAVGLVTMLALFEYFALGEAIGHRAYRFWTGTCALLLVFTQWNAPTQGPRAISRIVDWIEIGGLTLAMPTVEDVLFYFLICITVLTLWTMRPMVETMPAAGF